MKRVLIASLIILMAAFVMWAVLGGIFMRVNTSFATNASIRANYAERNKDVVITDANDIKMLKKILSGWARPEATGCMFDADESITLTNGQRSMTFCPNFHDLDGGDQILIKIGETRKYLFLSDSESRALGAIYKKYGVKFPP